MFFDNYLLQCNKKGISPTTAALEMGFHRSEVSRWGNGTTPRRANLMKMVAYFGCEIEDLTKEIKIPATDGDGLTEAQQELIRLVLSLTDQELSVLASTAKAQIAARKSQGDP